MTSPTSPSSTSTEQKASRQRKLQATSKVLKRINPQAEQVSESVKDRAAKLQMTGNDLLSRAVAASPDQSRTPASAPVTGRGAKPGTPPSPGDVVAIITDGDMLKWTKGVVLLMADIALDAVHGELVEFTGRFEKVDRTTSDLRELRNNIRSLKEAISDAVVTAIQVVFFPKSRALAKTAGRELIKRIGHLAALGLVFQGVKNEDMAAPALRAPLDDVETFANLGDEIREQKINSPTVNRPVSLFGDEKLTPKPVRRASTTPSATERAANLFPTGAYPVTDDDERWDKVRTLANKAATALDVHRLDYMYLTRNLNSAVYENDMVRAEAFSVLTPKRLKAKRAMLAAGLDIVTLLYFPGKPGTARVEYRDLVARFGAMNAFAEVYYAATRVELASEIRNAPIEPTVLSGGHTPARHKVREIVATFYDSYRGLKALYNKQNPPPPDLKQDELALWWTRDPGSVQRANDLAFRTLVRCEELLNTRSDGTAKAYVEELIATQGIDVTKPETVSTLLADYLAAIED
jgi:hypothetical protein